MAAFGKLFEYQSVKGEFPRFRFDDCRLLQAQTGFPEGSRVDTIWFDVVCGEMWFVPDNKCSWDISENFLV